MVQDMIGKEVRNYHLISRLGEGSFGTVYLGEHVHNKTQAAIKVLRTQLSVNELKQFINEVSTNFRLKHSHIIQLLDFGIDEPDLPFLVLEYAPNKSLRDRLKRQPSRPLPAAEALTILSQIGQALQYAHNQGIVHRDLKPANILFNAKGDALLADFGIAVILEKTTRAQGAGTVAYMSPEQFEDIVSKKSDQYALGCIAYELLTGQRPFVANNFRALAWKHINDQPILPRQLNSNLPEYMEQAILKAMAKNREERYSDISNFVIALNTPPQLKIQMDENLIHSSLDNSTISMNVTTPIESIKESDDTIDAAEVLNKVHRVDIVPISHVPEIVSKEKNLLLLVLVHWDELMEKYREEILKSLNDIDNLKELVGAGHDVKVLLSRATLGDRQGGIFFSTGVSYFHSPTVKPKQISRMPVTAKREVDLWARVSQALHEIESYLQHSKVEYNLALVVIADTRPVVGSPPPALRELTSKMNVVFKAKCFGERSAANAAETALEQAMIATRVGNILVEEENRPINTIDTADVLNRVRSDDIPSTWQVFHTASRKFNIMSIIWKIFIGIEGFCGIVFLLGGVVEATNTIKSNNPPSWVFVLIGASIIVLCIFGLKYNPLLNRMASILVLLPQGCVQLTSKKIYSTINYQDVESARVYKEGLRLKFANKKKETTPINLKYFESSQTIAQDIVNAYTNFRATSK